MSVAYRGVAAAGSHASMPSCPHAYLLSQGHGVCADCMALAAPASTDAQPHAADVRHTRLKKPWYQDVVYALTQLGGDTWLASVAADRHQNLAAEQEQVSGGPVARGQETGGEGRERKKVPVKMQRAWGISRTGNRPFLPVMYGEWQPTSWGCLVRRPDMAC
jgi:hypothetical protein